MKYLKLILIFNLVVLLLTSSLLGTVSGADKSVKMMNKIKKYNLYSIVSTYTTYFDSLTSNRVRNIKITAQILDGTVIKPGATFSFNQVVGPRTKERGFRAAPEIVNGQITQGIGGGICQVSSTLYNAVLLADLKVVERVHHSRPVDYVKLGRGATVYYNQIDFKFKNNASFPVLIMARVSDKQLTISILGQENRGQVEIYSSQVEVLKPEVKREIDRGLSPGQKQVVTEGRKGYRVVVKKVVKKAGTVVANEVVSEDIYAPHPQLIKVNPEE